MNLFGSVNLIVQSTSPAVLVPAKIWWLTDSSDWRFVRQWKRSSLTKGADSGIRDSIEYALLAGKRWRFLMQQKFCVTGWSDLRRHLTRDSKAELGMALALTGSISGRTSVLGFGFVRRTWANNLILEFLAGSPAALTGIKGVGTVLIQSVAQIGVWLSAKELWGECTEASRGFYHTLKTRFGLQSCESVSSRQPPNRVLDRFQFDFQELSRMLANSPIKMEPCPHEYYKPS